MGNRNDARPDTRSASEWYREARVVVGPRRRLPRSLFLALALALVAGVVFAGGRILGFDPTTTSREVVNSLLHDMPEMPPLEPPTAPPTPEPPVPGGQADPDPDAFRERYRRFVDAQPNLAEGRDYSFIHKIEGTPVRWSCTRAIPVVLAGRVPNGAEPSFKEVVGALAGVSGLPLQPVRDAAGRPPTAGEVVVYYAAEGARPGTISAEGTVAGRAGPRFYVSGPTAGMVGAGEVVVRNDIQGLEPTTARGKDVLAHEVMHALGLGHSARDLPEVMAPFVDDTWPAIGAGDRLALRVVGCGNA